MTDKARERTLEDVQVSCGSLDVGEGFRISGSMEFKPRSADEREAKTSEQLFMVGLADTEENYDLVVQIVQNFNFGRLFLEKHLGTTGKGFHIRRVLRKYFN